MQLVLIFRHQIVCTRSISTHKSAAAKVSQTVLTDINDIACSGYLQWIYERLARAAEICTIRFCSGGMFRDINDQSLQRIFAADLITTTPSSGIFKPRLPPLGPMSHTSQSPWWRDSDNNALFLEKTAQVCELRKEKRPRHAYLFCVSVYSSTGMLNKINCFCKGHCSRSRVQYFSTTYAPFQVNNRGPEPMSCYCNLSWKLPACNPHTLNHPIGPNRMHLQSGVYILSRMVPLQLNSLRR